jgi:hypothetical protein
MPVNPLPLSIIADVTVITSSPQVAAPSFNTGLIIGSTSTGIPITGPNPRIRKYLAATYSTAMITDGYTTASPEFIAAQMYFSQSPQPQAVFIGRQDLTVPETPLQAVMACRAMQPQWYCCMVCGAVDADHIAISAWVASQIGTTYFGTTSDSDVLDGTTGNVLLTIFATSAKRTWMQYATTQGGLTPNQAYFVAAVMGQAMASNSQLANSYFTEKFSGGVPLNAVVIEPGLTTSQIGNIEGVVPAQGPNGNLFLNYANAFNILEQGTMMALNVFFDQVLNLDILASNIQYAILNLLTSVPSVPQTDAGQQMLIQAVETALDTAVNVGFIAPGTWQGQTISVGPNSSVTPGQSLPAGYIVLSPSYAIWGKNNPGLVAARQAPPIYVALIEAGAVHFVTVEVLVQV